MKEIEVNFQDAWPIEKRKMAVNEAIQSQMPFEIKSMTVIPEFEDEEQPYTGGTMQLLTARRMKLTINTKS